MAWSRSGRANGMAPEAVRKIRETKGDWTFDATEAKRRQREAAREVGLPITRKVDLGKGAVTVDVDPVDMM